MALNDGVCKAAKLAILGEKTAEVTLQEGRYHQIKRMFGCFGAKVVSLHRLAMGNLYLPADLPEGACRELTAEELNQLQMHESIWETTYRPRRGGRRSLLCVAK